MYTALSLEKKINFFLCEGLGLTPLREAANRKKKGRAG